MKYVVSDIHGEYELFRSLLNCINFSSEDTLYICGDIIDKGSESIRLAEYISGLKSLIDLLSFMQGKLEVSSVTKTLMRTSM